MFDHGVIMSWNRGKSGKAKKLHVVTFLFFWVSILATSRIITVSSFVPTTSNGSRDHRRYSQITGRFQTTTADESSHSTVDDSQYRPVECSDVIIVGGGLTGMATAVALQNRIQKNSSSFNVTIYEQAKALRKIGAAIGLYPNGLAALEYIDPIISQKIQQTASPCQTFERRDWQDTVVQITNVPVIQATAPVMYAWFLLQQALRDALLVVWPEKNTPSSCCHVEMGHTFQRYDLLDNGLVQVEFERHEDRVRIIQTCRLLVGADGIHSRVREQMMMTQTLPDSEEKASSSSLTTAQTKYTYYGKVMYRSVLDRCLVEKVLDLPEGTQISWQGTTKGQSFSLRETTEGIVTVTAAAVVTNNATTTTASISKNAKRDNNNNNQDKKKRLHDLFQEFPSVVQQIINNLSNHAIHEDYIRDVSIPTQWSDPEGPVVLVGDAAHAMTPHMGQGANMGLEDVCELVHRIVPILRQKEARTDKSNDVWNDALVSYCQSRLSRVREVQDRSRQNTLQSNTYDKQTASIPFERRQYSESFKDRLYNWKPPFAEEEDR